MTQEPTISHGNISESLKRFPLQLLKFYPKSFVLKNGLIYGLIRNPEGKKLVVLGEKAGVLADPFKGKTFHDASTLKVCDLTLENTQCLMDLFPFTKPIPLLRKWTTIGTGDRLGLATPGHLRAVNKFPVRPVLAQQSVRENIQTGRNFPGVIQDAAWGVFLENYQKGYGADGDHLKTFQEIKSALDAGVSMVTLDLSEKLNPKAFEFSKEMLDREFQEAVDAEEMKVLSHLFLEKEFHLKGPQGECRIQFNEEELKRNVLLYQKAIDFTEEAYEFIVSQTGHRPTIDFEISIDETPFPTTPENHLFFVIQATQRGVQLDSLAPRFVGEFQKGIDYIGDLRTFREQYLKHSLIAQHYGNYKISIHSGSDKFTVFPEIGRLSKGGFHLKTAGTSWLEAVRLIAEIAPPLYRQMHEYALSVFKDAAKLYHVTTDLEKIPDVHRLKDQELVSLLDEVDSRQLLHITYGYLLNAKTPEGADLFRNRFFHVLTQFEEEYWSLLERHIEKHLVSLGVEKGEGP